MRASGEGEATDLSEISAYHEAGHAFMALDAGARVRSVTIEPDRDVEDIVRQWLPDRRRSR